jgi:hypothetical protein
MSMFCAASSGFKNLKISNMIPWKAHELCFTDYLSETITSSSELAKLSKDQSFAIREVMYESCVQGVSEYAQAEYRSPYGQTELDSLDFVPKKMVDHMEERKEFIQQLNNMRTFSEEAALVMCARFAQKGSKYHNLAAFGTCMGGALSDQKQAGERYGMCTVENLWEIIKNLS